MSIEEAHEYLIGQVGYESFRVKGLDDDAVEELCELLAIKSYTNIGRRSLIGKWLSSNSEHVEVLSPADGSVAGVFRMI